MIRRFNFGRRMLFAFAILVFVTGGCQPKITDPVEMKKAHDKAVRDFADTNPYQKNRQDERTQKVREDLKRGWPTDEEEEEKKKGNGERKGEEPSAKGEGDGSGT